MKSRKSAKKFNKSSTKRDRGGFRSAVRTFETLEDRRLLAANPWSEPVYAPIGAYTGRLIPGLSPAEYKQRARQDFPSGGTGSGMSGEGAPGTPFAGADTEPNDTFRQAQFVPLGTGDGQSRTATITGTTTFIDQDYYALDLKAGDIFDAQISAATGTIWDLSLRDASDREVAGTNAPLVPPAQPLLDVYPPSSPLSRGGRASFSIVIPTSGRYYARVGDGPGPYSLNMNVFRPVLEQETVGTKQILFLDFDGADVPISTFIPGLAGTGRLSPLSDFLAGWNLNPSQENLVIDSIIQNVAFRFGGTIPQTGTNGYFTATGTPGQFDIEIRNSRDHIDPWGEPNVSRVVVGGTQNELGIQGIYGIAQSVDIGNFDTTETGVVLLDTLSLPGIPTPGPALSINDIPISGTKTRIDLIGEVVGNIVAHEAGHFFGNWHQVNSPYLTMSTGLGVEQDAAVGPDGVYGTADDGPRIQFGIGRYDAAASAIPFGISNSPANIAWGLATGTVGGATIRGTVFNDRNVNRVYDAGDVPGPQVVVWADNDNDGLFEPDQGEFFTVSNLDGSYALTVPPGTQNVRVGPPLGWRTTTPVTQSVSVPAGGNVANINFGLEKLNQTITGIKWNDLNGNGLRDPGEPGIAGVWIYLDLDGDNRIDIGEPATLTGPDGSYKLNFPGPGTYAVREVVSPGFVQTFPNNAEQEHIVVITGNAAIDGPASAGLNFGNKLTIDFGDAPASYGVASHGFVNGLLLGSLWDAEPASRFSADARGDDLDNLDDEDGIVLARPLVAGSTTNRINVTAQNLTADPAYLHAWIDFNGDGDFTDPGERIISNAVVGNQPVTTVTFAAPATANLGSAFARFRYSTVRDLGPTGAAPDGEVEDYLLTIVDTLELAVDDRAQVPRNSVLNEIDVLANDFRLPGESLEVVNVSASRVGGTVTISTNNTVLYTPPSGFIGQDSFTYTMRNSAGETDDANVIVDVNLFFDNPVAIDDSFDVPTNAVDFPLNVLANDIEGRAGALTIVSVTQPDKNGEIDIATGGKSLRYTPPRDLGDTEFFTYTVADAAGNQSTANVTLHTLPGDRLDDQAQIRLVATDLAGNPITAIPQGERFRIDVLLDDLRFSSSDPGSAAGVFAAYADLLYNLQLVSTVPAETSPSGFSYQVNFFNNYTNGRTGDGTIPGIIDEFGAFFSGTTMNVPDPVRMASITFEARTPGIARFLADPADNRPQSDTLLFDIPGSPVPIERIQYIGTSVEIVGDGTQFPVAVDDSVPEPIAPGTIRFPIDVLANDRPGTSGPITIQSVSSPRNGLARINGNRVEYTPNIGFSGLDQFTYTIQDSRGIQSTATVTVRTGNADANDIVSFRLQATDLSGQPIDQITVGSQFQLRGFVQDIRGAGANRGIFAAYQDVLYSSSLVSPVPSTTNDPNLGFQIQFGPNYQRVREGDNRTVGLLNEVGAVSTVNTPLGTAEQLLFVVTMTANGTGTARFIGDPADVMPAHDTLTFEPVAPVAADLIRYGFDSLVIVSGSGGGSGEGFTNSDNPLDVNADGYVSPIDVLAVINSLNSGGSRPLDGSGGEGESGGKLYIDTNGDGVLSPIDALLVINYLNSMGSGEGEAFGEAVSLLAGAPVGDTSATFGELPKQSNGSLSDVPTGLSSNASDLAAGAAPEITLATDMAFDDGDEDEEGLLDQLAPEIEENWKRGLLV